MTTEELWCLALMLAPALLIRSVPATPLLALACAWASGIVTAFGYGTDFGEHAHRFQALAGMALVSLGATLAAGWFIPWLSALPLVAFIENPAMRGTLMAMAFPFVLARSRWLAVGLAALILLTGASTPLALLGVSLCVYYRIFWPAIGALFIGLATQGGAELFNSNGRFGIWPLAFRWWSEHVNPVMGTGLGSFAWLGPMIQATDGQRYTYFTWMHNDWLQILFEQGFVGLASVAYLFTSMLWRARERRELQSAIFVYGAAALTQMPLHFFPTALFGAILVKETYFGESSSQQ